MSLHSHISNLNEIGLRLAGLSDRARQCADALEGGHPEPARERSDGTGTPVSSNIDAKLTHTCRQYDDVVSQLAAQIDRIEQHVMDMPYNVGPTKAAY